SKEQLQRLYSRFIALDKQSEGSLRREDLERIPELYVNPVSQFLLDAFFRDRNEINFLEFGRPTSINRREAKLRFLFDMYDLDRDGVISVDEVHRMLEELLGRHGRPDQVLSIARRIVHEAALDYAAANGVAEMPSGGQIDSIDFPAFEHAMRNVSDHQLSICFLS
uniref:EF-hand domain-containing protein n=1 Tax=Macrostomum lignano TaxID=282301 RepID=A0A1I8ICN7_9PLAT